MKKGFRKWNRIIALCLCALLAISTPCYAIGGVLDTADGEEMSAFFEQLLKVTEKNYRYDASYEQLLEAAVQAVIKEHPELFAEFAKGAYSILDENSRYLTQEEFQARVENVNGEFVGIGINVTEDNGKTIVGAPIEGSPAASSGLMPGDVIVSVDGQSVVGAAMDKIVSLIRGEAGTSVEVGVERKGVPYTFTLQRALVKVNPVTYENLGRNNAGYIRLSAFTINTTEYFDAALADLSGQGVDKIILDLRGNGGGYLSEAVSVASNFIEDDKLIVTESYKNEKSNLKHHARQRDKKFKVVVLVDEYSASASEIVAGAIQDYNVGPLVGKTTFGKGTVQTTVKMKNQDAIWLTIAEYLLPNGENIHGTGINPDYMVSNKLVPADIAAMEEMDASRTYRLGDQAPGVLAIKQRMEAIGYGFNTIDDNYDDRLVDVITHFQQENGLYPYGVADLTTQLKIIEKARLAMVEEDTQLAKAKELIFSMK